MTGNLAYYSNPKEDPHMTLREEDDVDSDEDLDLLEYDSNGEAVDA